MKPHQERVLAEHAELLDKLNKLYLFIGTDTFNNLDGIERALLNDQTDAMEAYLFILSARLEHWSKQ